jgi:hypothetical protein
MLLTYSTPGLLDELLAVGLYRAEGILSDESFDQLRTRVIDAVKNDPGLGDRQTRGALLGALPLTSRGAASRFVSSSYSHKVIRNRIDAIRRDYLTNWHSELSRSDYQGESGSTPARQAAMLIAAFLLEVGVSHHYLSNWLSYRITHSEEEYDTARLVRELVELYTNGRGDVEILAIITSPVLPAIQAGDGWLTAKLAKAWLTEQGAEIPRKLHGGILFKSREWDIYGALERTTQAVERLMFRAVAKTGRTPNFHSTVWIKGVTKPQRLPARRGFTKSLPAYEFSNPSLDTPESDNRLEVAIEFLHGAIDSIGATAAGMSWTALESLFASPGDEQRGLQVANRAADVALVAYVRSQIYDCVGALRGHARSDPISVELTNLEGLDRIRRVEKLLVTGEYNQAVSNASVRLDLAHAADLLTVEGMRRKRADIRAIVLDLYRQRNVTLHGGITDSPLLHATLRDAVPIVSAVVNRYASRIRSSDTITDSLVFAFEATRTVERAIGGDGLLVFFE